MADDVFVVHHGTVGQMDSVVLMLVAALGASSCSADAAAPVATPVAPIVSTAPVTVTLLEAKSSASVAALPPPAKVRNTAVLLASGTYELAYALQSEHSCSESMEGHSASGTLTLEIHGADVTVRLDDSFGHVFGPSIGRYTTAGGSFQHDAHDRHLTFSGKQVAEGDHIHIDVGDGIALNCQPGDVELSPPVNPNAPDDPNAKGPILKGFSCTDGSKLFDAEYDRLGSVAGTLSFVPGKKLSLNGNTLGAGYSWTRLEVASP